MIWNNKAEQYLKRFVESYVEKNSAEGINAEDFLVDIKSHVEESCTEKIINEIDENEVKNTLKKMGFENLDELTSQILNDAQKNKNKTSGYTILGILFLVIMPQMCAIVGYGLNEEFNRILLIAVSLNGFINGYLLYISKNNLFAKQKLFFYCLYLNMFLSLYYMILFLPIVPIGLLGSLVGFGLLILNPYINFFLLLRLNLSFKKRLLDQNLYIKKHYKTVSASFILVLLVSAHCFDIAHLISYQLYRHGDQKAKQKGINILRAIGDRYQIKNGIGFFAFDNTYINYDYTVKKEMRYKAFGKVSNNRWDYDFDGSSGNFNEFVGNQRSHLWLSSSEIDGSVSAENGIAYMEWTMVFKNDWTFNDEARAIIKLPTDSVVSRLTLWVKGEEQEAAFAKQSTVEEAYNSVVSKNRDPVLIQYNSPDTITMKCFPINTTTPMKIRIGFTAPVQYLSDGKAYVKTPYILKKNFRITPTLLHYIWLESKQALTHEDKLSEPIEEGFKLKFSLKNDEVKNGAPIYFSVVPENIATYMFPLNEKEMLLSQVKEVPSAEINKIVLFVDFGANIKKEFRHLEEALSKLPNNVDIIIYCIGDQIEKLTYKKESNDLTNLKKEFMTFKAKHGLVGGHDFAQAITQGLDDNGLDESTLFVWVHGNIPFALSGLEPIEKILLRSNKKPNLIEFSTIDAGNILTSNSTVLANLKQGYGPYIGLKNLPVFFHSINKTKLNMQFEVKGLDKEADYAKGSRHHARIWANQEIIKMGINKNLDLDKAISLSTTYQLVTPYVGAVVLENQEQYDRFDLKQVDSSSVPSIPEPEEWALIIVFILMALYLVKTKAFRKMQHA